VSYPSLLRSLGAIFGQYGALRWAILRQGGLFAAFSAFWSILALYLAQRYHVGSAAAGLYGIVGFGGVLVAPFAGRRADAQGPYGLIVVGIGLLLAGFVVFLIWPSYVGIAAGAFLMDAGVQMSMVSHQSIIFALSPESRNRINTLYMTGMFLCGAAGSALASAAWGTGGWNAVMGLGLILGLTSLAAYYREAHQRHNQAAS
jgi:MFS family permease